MAVLDHTAGLTVCWSNEQQPSTLSRLSFERCMSSSLWWLVMRPVTELCLSHNPLALSMTPPAKGPSLREIYSSEGGPLLSEKSDRKIKIIASTTTSSRKRLRPKLNPLGSQSVVAKSLQNSPFPSRLDQAGSARRYCFDPATPGEGLGTQDVTWKMWMGTFS